MGDRIIDCAECVMAGTSACDDCVVTFILERDPGDARETTAKRPEGSGAWSRPMRVVVDAEEERALRALGDSGMVPRLRHRSRRAV